MTSITQQPWSEAERQLRIDLAAAFRIAVTWDMHEGICNHFTARLPGEQVFLLNHHGLHWREVTAGNLIRIVPGSNELAQQDDDDKVAYHIHAPVYRRRPDINCVLHTHMPYATALCMLDRGRLDMGLQTATMFHDRIAYDDDYPASVAAAGEAEGERLADALANRDVLFMRNHGILVAGHSVGAAMHDIYYLERACRMQWIARAYAEPKAMIPQAALEAQKVVHARWGDRYKIEHFEALKRLLDKDEPDYRDM
jgi:ribulose-5-phosphate 4-epimerase/fuculose-1-phosphate aldolase